MTTSNNTTKEVSVATRTKAAQKSGGFWDTHEVKAGGNGWLTPTEKNDMIEEKQVFSVVGIEYDPENTYQGNKNPRYVVTLLAPDAVTGEETKRYVGFPTGSVESRDEILEQMQECLDSGEFETIDAQLYRGGRAILINAPGL